MKSIRPARSERQSTPGEPSCSQGRLPRSALKAYVTPRAFVRTDMKLVFDKGIDEVLLRLGIGVDF